MKHTFTLPVSLLRKRPLLVGIVFLTVFTLITFSLQQAHTHISEFFNRQTTSLHAERARLQKHIADLPSPEKIRISNPSTIQPSTTAARATHRNIEQVARNLEGGYGYTWLAAGTGEHSFFELRRANRTIRSEAGSIRADTSAYVDVLVALEDFFVYNPETDTATFSSGSADTNERMERLRNGLSDARSGVSVHADDHRFAAEIVTILESAQASQTRLENTGDTKGFVTTFTRLQKQCRSVLVSHYKETHPRLQKNAVDIGQTLP